MIKTGLRGRKATFIIKNREYKGKKTDGRRVKNEKNKPGRYAGADTPHDNQPQLLFESCRSVF